jgi:hypothetical protein
MLSFLGLGAAAGPALVQQYSSNPVPTQGYYDDGAIKASLASVGDQKEYVKRMQEELGFINSDPAKWIADRALSDMKDYMMGYSGVSYQNIDPDIRNMKSITELAKMRIYYERKAKRQFEVQKESLTHRIAEALGFKNG